MDYCGVSADGADFLLYSEIDTSRTTKGNVHYSEVQAYNVEAYAEGRILKSSNQTLIDACKWIVVYGQMAKDYFAK